ncbi:MAG: flagellar hook-basal body complex protein FliE [Phycisphaerae bacterium]|nr:flagellar hook-basal body complex protein FliE [Phycisphaerae bacterium]
MSDPLMGLGAIEALRGVSFPDTTSTSPAGSSAPVEGKDFKSFLMESLEKVSRLQQDADAGVQKLLTGETDNVAEVFTASRKAGIAFDLLMEIRNKLMDAYGEVKQMRV